MILTAVLLGSLQAGGCIVLTDVPRADPFQVVVEAAVAAAGGGEPLRFVRPADALEALRRSPPDHALVVLRPKTLDVNFAFELLDVLSRIDDDPFVDLGYGIVTGRTPAAALAFLAATEAVRTDPSLVKRSCLDVLGSNGQGHGGLLVFGRGAMLPAVDGLPMASANHGKRGFPEADLGRLGEHGFLHLGGHGVPERIEEGLTAAQLRAVRLPHALVWSGACWTGVTERSYDFRKGVVEALDTADSFCLAMLDAGVAAYCAAVHPDHGIPVYQEMEHLLVTGCDLGEAMRASYDAVVLASGGERPRLPRFVPGEPSPYRGERGEMERIGTAARVLLGDPRIRPLEPQVRPPYEVTVEDGPGELRVRARLRNLALRATHTDAFAGDLAAEGSPFNDRMALRVELPAGPEVTSVAVTQAAVREQPLTHRLVGWAVEQRRDGRRLHVQVDFATRGFQQSDYRSRQTVVELRVGLGTPR